MKISSEAIEAAVEAHCEGTMRAALEAAAPHMLAAGWDQGYKTGLFDKEYYSANPNPYRSKP